MQHLCHESYFYMWVVLECITLGGVSNALATLNMHVLKHALQHDSTTHYMQ